MPSPICEVKDGAGAFQSTANGATVTNGNVITVRLASTAGVDVWNLVPFGCDELTTIGTITPVIDPITKTATFTLPASGNARTVLFRSVVNNGKRPSSGNLVDDPTLTTTFGIYVPTGLGARVLATNEKYESNETFGWIASLNTIIRNPSAFPSFISGPFGIGGAAPAGSQFYVTGAGGVTIARGASSSGVPVGFVFTGAAHTGVTASTELNDILFSLNRTVTWATGALALQRFFRIRTPTMAFAGASVVTRAATFAIGGAPVAGTNATITQAWSLYVEGGASRFEGQVQSSNQLIGFLASRHAGDATASRMVFRKSRGSEDSPVVINAADELGGIGATGYNGSAYPAETGLAIFKADEAFTGSARGTRLEFHTTPTGSTTRAEVARFTPAGALQFAAAVTSHIRTAATPLLGYNGSEGFLFTDGTYAAQVATGRLYAATAMYFGLGAANYFGIDSNGVGVANGGQNAYFHAAPSYGGGSKVIYRGQATTNPSTNPTGGVVEYIDSSDMFPKARMPAGTVLVWDIPDPSVNGLRLTASSGNPIPQSDIAASTNIYLTPYRHSMIALRDGVDGPWRLRSTSEITLALGTLVSGKNYDVCAYWTGSAVAIELRTAWTNDNTRAETIIRTDGILSINGANNRRYLGTIRTISTTQIADTEAQRFVWNWENQVRRHAKRIETTDTWTYNSTTVRQARATAANRVEILIGQPAVVQARVSAIQQGTGSSGLGGIVGVGIDQTTTYDSTNVAGFSVSNEFASGSNLAHGEYNGLISSVGYHTVNWLESCSAAATVTFSGDSGFTGVINSHIVAHLDM